MQLTSWLRLLFALVGSVLFIDGSVLIALKKIHIGTVLPLLLGLFSVDMRSFIIILNVSFSIISAYIPFGALAGYASGSG